jgi:hypothetical protein
MWGLYHVDVQIIAANGPAIKLVGVAERMEIVTI